MKGGERKAVANRTACVAGVFVEVAVAVGTLVCALARGSFDLVVTTSPNLLSRLSTVLLLLLKSSKYR